MIIIVIIIIIMTIRLRRLSFLVDELINFSEDAEASKQILRCIDVIIIIYVILSVILFASVLTSSSFMVQNPLAVIVTTHYL